MCTASRHTNSPRQAGRNVHCVVGQFNFASAKSNLTQLPHARRITRIDDHTRQVSRAALAVHLPLTSVSVVIPFGDELDKARALDGSRSPWGGGGES